MAVGLHGSSFPCRPTSIPSAGRSCARHMRRHAQSALGSTGPSTHELMEDRYGRGATLLTSQVPVDRWHDLIGEPTVADAILDRIVHNAHRVQLRGDSLRRKRGAKAAEA